MVASKNDVLTFARPLYTISFFRDYIVTPKNAACRGT